ncbi:MAG: glycosyltransferase family 4 protein [Thermodesulfobacteriota bacterium]
MAPRANKIRVAVVWPGYRKYNLHFFELLKNDPRLEVSVLWVLDFRKDDPPPPDLLAGLSYRVLGARNIRISGYGPRLFLRLCRSLWAMAGAADCVFTSTQAPLHSKLAFCIARLRGRKVFVKTEQWREFGRNSFLMRQYKKIDGYVMRHCDMLLPHGVSQVRFARSLGVRPERIRVMPFLSDDLGRISRKRPGLRRELGLEERKVVLYFGRITPQKGLLDLLAAASRLKERVPGLALLVCGGADSHFLDFRQAEPYERECRDLAGKLPAGMAHFTGPVRPEDRQEYFAAADLFVHPHTAMGELTDGWSLVLNEATSMSLPIVATDRVGAAADLVEEGVNGFVVPAGDREALADRIACLLEDEGKLQSFALASRRVFERYHRPERIVAVLLEAADG